MPLPSEGIADRDIYSVLLGSRLVTGMVATVKEEQG